MIKNNICFGSVSKQNALFSKKCALNNAPMPYTVQNRPCICINVDKYTQTQLVQIIQINIHKNNGIKTNSFSFILMIHWWLKEHLFSRTCQVTNQQYAYIFFKKSELFCFHLPTRLICYGKTDTNQTINCDLSPCVLSPLWANGGSVVSFIHAKYGFSSMGSRCYSRTQVWNSRTKLGKVRKVGGW